MDFSNVTMGNKPVAEVWMGSIKIYPSTPSSVFTVNRDEFNILPSTTQVQFTITSIYNGSATGMSYTTPIDTIGISSVTYVEGSGLGTRVYTVSFPPNQLHEDQQARLIFTQYGSGNQLQIDIYRDEMM